MPEQPSSDVPVHAPADRAPGEVISLVDRSGTVVGAAARELAEELAISGTELRTLGLSVYEDDKTRCVKHCFETTWDGPVTHADGEVVWGAWMTLAELDRHLADPTWSFVPDTRALLTRLAATGVGDYAALVSLRGAHP